MKEKPLAENAVLPHTETKKLSFHFHLDWYHYLNEHRDALFCFCFKLILSIGSVKVFLNFTMVMNCKRVHLVRDYNLFNLLVKI